MLPAKGTGDEALKAICDKLKNTVDELQNSVKDLQSMCKTHENSLEMLRKETAGFW